MCILQGLTAVYINRHYKNITKKPNTVQHIRFRESCDAHGSDCDNYARPALSALFSNKTHVCCDSRAKDTSSFRRRAGARAILLFLLLFFFFLLLVLVVLHLLRSGLRASLRRRR